MKSRFMSLQFSTQQQASRNMKKMVVALKKNILMVKTIQRINGVFILHHIVTPNILVFYS